MSCPNITTPAERYGKLFDAVQRSDVFPDSKQFVDAIPKAAPKKIMTAYEQACQQANFNLATFVAENFTLPQEIKITYPTSTRRSVCEHVELLWNVLSQSEQPKDGAWSSLIPLPKPYIVPGGRFREIYYWDSYFTLLGLTSTGRVDMLESMVDNFAYLIDQVGFVPNGNRSYFCSRSQPPFFALLVTLLAETLQDNSIYSCYLTHLEKEYQFWMDGSDGLQHDGEAYRRVIKIKDGFLNRYWDDIDQPRQESYREDLELAERSAEDPKRLYRNIRAACESGWDFSSRWLEDNLNFATIRTTQVVPVDLNCLMYYLEDSLALAYKFNGGKHAGEKEAFYHERAKTRKKAIQNLFFNQKTGFFCDLLLPNLQPSSVLSLAGAFPLFFNLATEQQAEKVAKILGSNFLKAGGWVTTLLESDHQWDSPNGWAPLQWIVYKGLRNYGFMKEAKEGASRWVDSNERVYKLTGQLMEKYNVEQPDLVAKGGEYEAQHGFGWTNGVLIKMMDELRF